MKQELTIAELAERTGLSEEAIYQIVLAGLISAPEAAALLDVQPESIYSLVTRGRLVSFKVGNLRLITRDSLEGFRSSIAGRRLRPGPKEAAA